MIRAAGRRYDGATPRAEPAEVFFEPGGSVRLSVGGAERVYRLAEVRVSPRVGITPRHLRFPDGLAFETDDNDAVDAALAKSEAGAWGRRVARLEGSWRAALAALAITALASWALVRFGLPEGARLAASLVPPSTDRALGKGALDLMDRHLFAPTGLPAADRQRMQRLFEEVAGSVPDAGLSLELRRGVGIGANAFALPSGLIVVTDQMVRIAHADQELSAVLAHEAGHVLGRHALRRALQGSGVALLGALLTGDLSSTSTLAASLPTALVDLKYSREFEREADDFAREFLQERGISPSRLGDLLRRIETESQGLKLPTWLSTHPPTEER